MKVIIMTDLEGISLVDTIDMISESKDGYKFACERLMEDVNAAVQGAADAGADEILVFDGHGRGHGHNFSNGGPLDPRAKLLTDFNAPGLLDDCVGYLEIGLHAKPGTLNGFLDHCQSSAKWFEYCQNGVAQGELAQGAAYVGAYGVPVVMVSGDEAACEEAKALIPGIETAVVKKGIGRNKAECLDSETSLRLIREAAYRGIKKAAEIKPYIISLPVEVKVTFYRSDMCDEICEAKPYLTRVDARTVTVVRDKIVTYRDLLL